MYIKNTSSIIEFSTKNRLKIDSIINLGLVYDNRAKIIMKL